MDSGEMGFRVVGAEEAANRDPGGWAAISLRRGRVHPRLLHPPGPRFFFHAARAPEVHFTATPLSQESHDCYAQNRRGAVAA